MTSSRQQSGADRCRYWPAPLVVEQPGMNATVTLTPKGGLMFRVRELS